MIAFLHSLFAFLTELLRSFKRLRRSKASAEAHNTKNKADAYDKLSKALRARNNARERHLSNGGLPNDSYKRNEDG